MPDRIWNITDSKGPGYSIEVQGHTLLPGSSMQVVLDKHIQRLIDNKALTLDPRTYLAKKRNSRRDPGV